MVKDNNITTTGAWITAKVPLSQMHQYSSSLRSLTQGRARFNMRFHSYAPVAAEVQRKLVEAHSRYEVLVEV